MWCVLGGGQNWTWPSPAPKPQTGLTGAVMTRPAPLTGPRKPNNILKDVGKTPRVSVYLYTRKPTCGPNETFVQF